MRVRLLAFAAGAIAGMQVSGRLVDRRSSAAIMIAAVFADGLVLVLPAYAANLVSLAVFLFTFGTVHGVLNVAMNVNAVQVQRAYGRPIISSLHAVYSVGGGSAEARSRWSLSPARILTRIPNMIPERRRRLDPSPRHKKATRAANRSCGQTLSSSLAGLALSGGGIRSASFCLGALQALDSA